MKRFLFSLLLVSLVMVACEKAETNVQELQSDFMSPKLISQTEALDIVIDHLHLFNDNKTKNTEYKILSSEVIEPLTKSDNDSPLYLFNFNKII